MAADTSQKIPFYEKLGYSLGDSAANFVFLTMVCFQQGFYTDVMGLAPSKAALAILVPRLWDAFFDPIIGSTADRTKTRWGRFRPWVLWTAVPWSIVMVLAYFTPTGWSDAGMLTWAIVTNTLLMTLYSANNMPYAALGGVMTSDQSERNKLNAVRFGAVVFAQWIVQTFTLVIRDKFAGHSQAKADLAHGWTMTMGVYAVICLVCFLITFGTTKERVKPVEEAPTGGNGGSRAGSGDKTLEYATPTKKHSVGQDLAGLLKNSPWIVMFIVTFLHFTVISFQGGAGYQYFTRYPDPQATYDVFDKMGMTNPNIGVKDTAPGFLGTIGYIVTGTREAANHAHSAMYSALYGFQGTISKIFQLIGIMLAPMLAARFGKKAVCIVAFALTAIVNVFFYFLGPKDVGMMLVLTAVLGLVYGPGIPLLWAIFADVVDFGEWKLGIRTTGIIFATIGFGLKAGLAFGGAALSWVEEAVGYSDATPHVEMFRWCNTIVSAAVFFACMCVLCGLILNKKTTQKIADELAERRKAAEAAAPASA
jgi:Na+/melibiose symporter-like transporter